MRLLNTHTGEFEDETRGPKPDKYAILSHCWAKDPLEPPDLTYQDVLGIQAQVRAERTQNPDLPPDEVLARLPSKIRGCCQRAREDDIAFAWVDSCCIDKTSSAELTEAINSMYKWYAEATVCYAFLADVTPLTDTAPLSDTTTLSDTASLAEAASFSDTASLPETASLPDTASLPEVAPLPDAAPETDVTPLLGVAPPPDVASEYDQPHNLHPRSITCSTFRESRWFTRCWTLQELIAPKTLLFFAADWSMIGGKRELAAVIEGITGIDTSVLCYEQQLNKVSVARRMCWASKRTATRPEDEAYSLIGIFDVKMPVIYGEGSRIAFLRLQEEILRSIPDQSIFAWDLDPSIPTDAEATANARLLLAPSPASFSRSGSVESAPFAQILEAFPIYSFTPNGVHAALPLLPFELLYARDPFQTLDLPAELENLDLHIKHFRLLMRFVGLPSNISLLPLTCKDGDGNDSCSSRLALVVKTTDPLAEVDQTHLRETKDRKSRVAHLELVAFPTGDIDTNSDQPYVSTATCTPPRLSRLIRLPENSIATWFNRWSNLFTIKTLDSYIPYHPSTLRSRPDYVPITLHAMRSQDRSGAFLVITPEGHPLPMFSTIPSPSRRVDEGGDNLNSKEVVGIVHAPFPLSPFLHLHSDADVSSQSLVSCGASDEHQAQFLAQVPACAEDHYTGNIKLRTAFWVTVGLLWLAVVLRLSIMSHEINFTPFFVFVLLMVAGYISDRYLGTVESLFLRKPKFGRWSYILCIIVVALHKRLYSGHKYQKLGA